MDMSGRSFSKPFTGAVEPDLMKNMPSPIVFLDIAGPDQASLQTFYSTLFGWDAAEATFTIPVVLPLSAAIRGDPTEKRLYIGVEDISAKLTEVQAHGGSVDQFRFEVPGVVILGLFKDPAGNAMGLVEMEDGAAKVP
jgi:predicted enzyme related to lactoylglutathione lyase